MATKISNKIVGYKVLADQGPVLAVQEQEQEQEHMHEGVERPPVLVGATYKIAPPPLGEHALYVTINDIVLNAGTEHEQRRPYEIFLNSKNMEQFQWVLALTRVVSAVFRKGGDIEFLVEEFKAVFDPRGGYYRKGGVFMPSLVAEIGGVIETHLKSIGIIQVEEMSMEQKQFLDTKRREFESSVGVPGSQEFPEKATLCPKCSTKAVVLMDGCMTCLNCGESKCG